MGASSEIDSGTKRATGPTDILTSHVHPELPFTGFLVWRCPMSDTPSSRFSQLFTNFYELTDLPMKAFGTQIDWPKSITGVRRLLCGTHPLHLDIAARLMPRLAAAFRLDPDQAWLYVIRDNDRAVPDGLLTPLQQ